MLISNLTLNYETLVNESISIKISNYEESEYNHVYRRDIRIQPGYDPCNSETTFLVQINIIYTQM